MNIDEIKKLKSEIEETIGKYITIFEQTTKVKVSNIEIEKIDVSCLSGKETINKITFKIEL